MDSAALIIRLGGALASPRARIGIDLDNTLCESSASWMAQFARRCVAPAPHGSLSTDVMLSTYSAISKICEPCFLSCSSDPELVANYAPAPGALPVLTAFQAANVEVHIVTARTSDTSNATLAWLERFGFSGVIGSLSFAPAKRPRCEELGMRFLIDDNPSIVEDFASSSCEAVLYDRPYNRNIPCRRVQSWAEALSLAGLAVVPIVRAAA